MKSLVSTRCKPSGDWDKGDREWKRGETVIREIAPHGISIWRPLGVVVCNDLIEDGINVYVMPDKGKELTFKIKPPKD